MNLSPLNSQQQPSERIKLIQQINIDKPAPINQSYISHLNQPNRVIYSHSQLQPSSQPLYTQHKKDNRFNKSRVVVNEQTLEELKTIAPTRRIQYVPYEEKYVEYVEQRIKVPVQRYYTDYYQIEHIIQYVPIEKEQIVYERQAKQVVEMRLQYVPVEQKIIHISDKNAKALGITEYVASNQEINSSPLYKPVAQSYSNYGISFQNMTSAKKSKTNYITSEGYDPESNLKEIDRILSQSSVRGSRIRT